MPGTLPLTRWKLFANEESDRRHFLAIEHETRSGKRFKERTGKQNSLKFDLRMQKEDKRLMDCGVHLWESAASVFIEFCSEVLAPGNCGIHE